MSEKDEWELFDLRFRQVVDFLDRHQIKFFLTTFVALVVMTILEWRG